MSGEQRNPLQEYQVAHIPGALFFDVDWISDRTTNLPHMLPSEEAFAAAVSVGPVTFQTKYQPHLVWTLEQVKKNTEDQTHQLVDARSKARFDGVAVEPRKGIRCGHVPGSKCIPFAQMLDSSQVLLSADQLKKKFEQEGKLVNFTFLLSVLMNS
ncbi:hypothetical protein L2E82_37436 [Cichorium intybus]|uniref:Uncharacterized protein n=1 Tax=Cichorium intybus TaxID=13427 RepID=A0ACB9AF45_CICIN|nr:hypothetical protein L2E82_37436 [Cichorium intybus]